MLRFVRCQRQSCCPVRAVTVTCALATRVIGAVTITLCFLLCRIFAVSIYCPLTAPPLSPRPRLTPSASPAASHNFLPFPPILRRCQRSVRALQRRPIVSGGGCASGAAAVAQTPGCSVPQPVLLPVLSDVLTLLRSIAPSLSLSTRPPSIPCADNGAWRCEGFVGSGCSAVQKCP